MRRSQEELEYRAKLMAERAVGRTMKVSLAKEKHPGSTAKARTVEGPIVECKFSHWSGRDCIWQVVLEAGASKTRHVVHLRRIPA